MVISDADKTYLQSLLKDPSIGSRGTKSIYEAVKAQGRAYNAKTTTGLTNKDISEWFNSLTIIQTHKKIDGYNSFNPEYPLPSSSSFNTHPIKFDQVSGRPTGAGPAGKRV